MAAVVGPEVGKAGPPPPAVSTSGAPGADATEGLDSDSEDEVLRERDVVAKGLQQDRIARPFTQTRTRFRPHATAAALGGAVDPRALREVAEARDMGFWDDAAAVTRLPSMRYQVMVTRTLDRRRAQQAVDKV